jgi:hypothetical protein
VVVVSQGYSHWFGAGCSGADGAAVFDLLGTWSALDVCPSFLVFDTLAGRWGGEVLDG